MSNITLSTYLKHPRLLFIPLSRVGLFNRIPDKRYLQLLHKSITGVKPDLDQPVTFNEKIQHQKMQLKDSFFTMLVDKYAVRKFISSTIGDKYLVPLYGSWENPEEIDFGQLPDSFVIKCTHGCGSVLLCRDKNIADIKEYQLTLRRALKKNYFDLSRERPYKNAAPRIVAEKYIGESTGTRPVDYKFMCFNGRPEFVCISRALGTSGGCVSFYGIDGSPAPFGRIDYPECPPEIRLPDCFDKMKSLAAELAAAIDTPFVRVDLYEADGRIYFSEFTFFPCGGTTPFTPPEYDEMLGKMLILPEHDGDNRK